MWLVAIGAIAALPRTLVAQQPVATVAPPDSHALTELTLNGLLARNISWAYLAYLVRSHGLAFSPSAQLLEQIEAAGGAAVIPIIKAARATLTAATSGLNDDFVENLRECAMFFDKDDYAAAGSHCSAAATIDPTSPWPSMGLSEIAIEQKKYSDAVSFAHQAVSLAPMMAEAHFSLGEAFAMNGEGDSAADELKEAVELDPNEVDALVMLGDLYAPNDASEGNDAGVALTYYESAVILVPDDPDVHQRLASLYSKKNEPYAAVQEYETLERLEPKNDAWPRTEGKLLIETKNYPDAIAAYGRVLALKPDDADAYYWRGHALLQQKEYAAAVADLREAQLADPKNRDSNFDLGLALEDEGEYDPAVASFEQALQIDPKDCAAFVDISWARDRQKREAEALDADDRAIQCAGDDTVALDNLAIDLTNTGQPEKAVPILKQSLAINASDAGTHLDLGFAFERLRELKLAEAEYQKAADLAPQNPLAFENLCKAIDHNGEGVKAIPVCQRAVTLDPRSVENWWSFAAVLTYEKNFEPLIENARAATSRDAQSAVAWDTQALVLYKAGQLTQALDAAHAALALDPQNPALHIELGAVYESLGDGTRAITEERTALRIEPNNLSSMFVLAVDLWNNHDDAGAEALFQKTAVDGSHIGDSLMYLGLIADLHRDSKTAVEYDKKCLAHEPDNPTALSNFAVHLAEIGDVQGGLVYAQRVVAQHPDFPFGHKALGYVSWTEKNWPVTIAQYREAANLDPGNLQRQVDLAQMLGLSGDLEGAKKTYLAVLKKQPGNLDRWIDFGNLLMNMHDDTGALDAYKRAIALDSKNAVALNDLAWFYVTCFRPQFRNASQALLLARKANDLSDWKNPNIIDTYAAALDMNGQPANAAITERQAVYLAPSRTDLQAALNKYEAEAAKKPIQ
ncbi:MAG: tetratricopeptide repeat protein [Candidatus Acidiferrales bacterium]